VHAMAEEFAENGPFEDGYVVPFTTTTVNLISGGIAVNTIPSDCSLTFEFRSIAAIDADALTERFRAEARRIEEAMRQANPAARVDFTIVASAPGLSTADDAEVIELVAAWGGVPSTDKVTYGTEAGLFSLLAGVPTVVCGPGDIAQAHSPDEFVDLEQIALCEAFIDNVIAHARG
jgi:acetylornithine deacetylase